MKNVSRKCIKSQLLSLTTFEGSQQYETLKSIFITFGWTSVKESDTERMSLGQGSLY